VIHKGNNVEVITDVLPDEPLSVEGLIYYYRSRHLQIIRSKEHATPYMTLKNVDPKPLWKFPGHETIKDDWFTHILLFDSGEYELHIDAMIVKTSKCERDPVVRYESGEFVLKPGTRLVIGESGMVWRPYENTLTPNEAVLSWRDVSSLMSKEVS
jgi:hypothetical protein